MILNDTQIRREAAAGMIAPFAPQQVRESEHGKVISYGVSSFGFDARVADEFRRVRDVGVLDPKGFNDNILPIDEERRYGAYEVQPHGFVLCRTVEYFRIPDDVIAVCFAKSTYARLGLVLGVTPLEPGWCGHVTLELSNTTPLPIRVYPNEGICQFLFFRGERPEVTYGDRNNGGGGKYQNQRGITLARM